MCVCVLGSYVYAYECCFKSRHSNAVFCVKTKKKQKLFVAVRKRRVIHRSRNDWFLLSHFPDWNCSRNFLLGTSIHWCRRSLIFPFLFFLFFRFAYLFVSFFAWNILFLRSLPTDSLNCLLFFFICAHILS